MLAIFAPVNGFLGGVERHIFDLAIGLRKRGHSVALVYAEAKGRDSGAFCAAFDSVVPISESRDILEKCSAVYAHKRFDSVVLNAIPPNIHTVFAVHDHDQTCVRSHRYLPISQEPCYRPPGFDCFRHGCVIVRSHDGLLPLSLRNPFLLASHTRTLARRGQLITGSAFMRNTLLDAGLPPDRVHVIHPVPPETPLAICQAPSRPVVGFAGQIIRGKGIDLLLQAIGKVPQAELVIAGLGNGLATAQQSCRDLGIAGRVRFLGALPPDRMHELYDLSRILVVPSRWPEPFGMVGIEAMRRSRPVVAAFHGGIPEWLAHEETGLGVRPNDSADLAQAIATLLRSPRYDEMAKAAELSARTRFSYDRMLDQIEKALHLAPTTAG